MRSVFRFAPAVMLLGLVLMGCNRNGGEEAPPDRPPKPVQGTLTLLLPGMT